MTSASPQPDASSGAGESAGVVPPPRRGFFRRIGRLPTWLIALLLLLPVPFVQFFGLLPYCFPWPGYERVHYSALSIFPWVVLCIPGAIKRWNWRHILLMLGVSAIVFGAYGTLELIPTTGYNWFLATVLTAVPFVLLGLGEAALLRRMKWRQLLWLAAGVLASAAALQLFDKCLWLTAWKIDLPGRWGMTKHSVGGAIYEPLRAVLVWLAIALALAVAQHPSRKRYVATGTAFAAALAALVVFVEVVSYPLAEQSLLAGGPFDRKSSVRWIANRGRDSDFDLLRNAVLQTKWTCSKERENDDYPWDYWRQTAIEVLAKRDSARITAELSDLFLHEPNVFIAGDAAELFAKHKRYETVPLLMRYALAEDSAECTTALEKMGEPRAALAIMRHRVLFEVFLSSRRLREFDQDTRDRLKKLLGEDPGPAVTAWGRLYDEAILKLTSPLPDPIREETDRVITATVRNFNIAGDWDDFVRLVCQRDGSLDREAAINLSKTIAGPNMDVPTTAALEKEVDDYDARVRKAIEDIMAKRR